MQRTMGSRALLYAVDVCAPVVTVTVKHTPSVSEVTAAVSEVTAAVLIAYQTDG